MIQSGDTISRYRIIGPLGRGGMGDVYQAEDLRLQRPVALKFLRSESLSDSDRQRFMNEARAAAVIRHPNICPIYDVEEFSGQIFIVMAYLEGETLMRRINRGPLPIRDVIDIGVQIASGLEKAHELGIVHRDIKSSNIIVSAENHAYILDFGLALRSGAERLTRTGSSVGTTIYMSPEQVRGQGLDGRTDVWALGVVLYEMLTGRHPFPGEQAATVIHAILSLDPPPIHSLRPDVPPDLERVVEKALAKNTEDRWRRARDLADQLQRLQESITRSSRSYHSAPTQTLWIPTSPPPPRRRAPTSAIIAGAVAIGLAAVAGGVYWKTLHPTAFGASQGQVRQAVVLPFQVIGSDENTRVVADGLVEILTATLSDFEKVGGKFMVVPASDVRSRGITGVEEARRVYGVNLALTGSAQRLGDKLQFTVSLVDSEKMRQIGAKTFVYDGADPLPSRDRAVEQVVRLMNLDLTPEIQKASTAGDSSSPSAYSAYLEGRGLLARFDQQGNLQKAVERFESATSTDPKFALAWAGLADAYLRLSVKQSSKALAQKALESGERAVQLDPGTAAVHATLGTVYGSAGRDTEAIQELKKAMELAPSSAEPLLGLARIYERLGRKSEAEALYLRATQARPTDWNAHYMLGWFYLEQEHYDKAEAALREGAALAPGNDSLMRVLGGVFILQGRYKEAIGELQNALKAKSDAGIYMTLASAYFLQHQFKEAVEAAETAIDLNPNEYYFWGNLGIYCKWVPGQESKSAPALTKAAEMARERLEIAPAEYDVRANLAEYRARLGDKDGALKEIRRIPEAQQQSMGSRIALAFELTGNRTMAIDLLRSKLTNPATLSQIRDDPDLAGLWNDPRFQAALPKWRP